MSVRLLYPPPPPPDAIPVNLDVGGKHFRTMTTTLKTMPSTRLGRIAQEAEKNNAKSVDLYFDRNPQIINSLLDLYRTGKLHLPVRMCVVAASEELRFWEVPRELLQDCCWKRLERQEDDKAVIVEMNRFLEYPYAKFTTNPPLTWCMKIWMVLERPDHSVASKIWSCIFFMFILLSVMTSAFETVLAFRTTNSSFKAAFPHAQVWSPLEAQRHMQLNPTDVIAISVPCTWLMVLRYITFAFFLTDFLLRLVLCPARIRFFRQAKNWMEVLIAAQTCFIFILESHVIPEKIESQNVTESDKQMHICILTFSVIRAFRVFYIAKYFDNMKVLLLCAKSSAKELLMLIVCVLSFITIFGTLAYISEILAKLSTFSSIPSGMWWALITMTTVGYGDVYPVSVFGKLVGSVCALSGLIVMALPIAVIASKFTLYHSNLSPREQNQARAEFLKENPQFDLTRNRMGQGEGEGEGQGRCGKSEGKGEEGGRQWKKKQSCWGGKHCRVDVVSLSKEVLEPCDCSLKY